MSYLFYVDRPEIVEYAEQIGTVRRALLKHLKNDVEYGVMRYGEDLMCQISLIDDLLQAERIAMGALYDLISIQLEIQKARLDAMIYSIYKEEWQQ